ncbi:hypothetical protein DFR56_12615 [Pseudogracilibacillus auburnensis]|uniref:Uncharacterized protein n=1 Tax=Pseudogracilibacillus auburnensis TaxID=1494959 RepID=A0A2V3VVF3_9BACI|nr:hypothetical protein DFR56_12615 [Pseudogracilibacillus auburnensis]
MSVDIGSDKNVLLTNLSVKRIFYVLVNEFFMSVSGIISYTKK